MKHKVSAVVAVALLAAAAGVTAWIVFVSSDSDATGGSGSASRSASRSASDQPGAARPKPSATPFPVPTKVVNPLEGGSYCATVKLLGIYAQQSYGLDPDLGLVKGRQFSKRLDLVAATYRRLAAQAAERPEVGAAASKAWHLLAGSVTAAGQKLQVTGYDVQSQVMILELAEVARATQTHLPIATSTLTAACGITRDKLGL